MAKVYIHYATTTTLAIEKWSHLIDESFLVEVPDELIDKYNLAVELMKTVQDELKECKANEGYVSE